jgi:hypothetical protein
MHGHEGFAVIWREAQRRRAELFGLWCSRIFSRLRRSSGALGALGYMAAGWDRMDLPPFSAGFVSIAAVLALMPTGFFAARLGARRASCV